MRVEGYLKNMGPPYTGNTSARSLDIVTKSGQNIDLREGRTSAADDETGDGDAYSVSLSKKGKMLSASEFQRGQKKEEDRFDRDQQRDFVAFKQQQARETANFEREQQRKLYAFKRKINNEQAGSV